MSATEQDERKRDEPAVVRLAGPIQILEPVEVREPLRVVQGAAGSEPWPVVADVTISEADVTSTDAPATAARPWSVAASTSSVMLLGDNPSRLGAMIYNDSAANLYAKYGITASSTDFTILIYPGSYYEIPFRYTGRVDGVWASATGAARVTDVF